MCVRYVVARVLKIPFCADIMTSVSSSCSLEIVACGAVNVLLNLVTQMNRSFAALSLVKTIIQILLNISKVKYMTLL